MAQKPDKFPDWATEEEIDEVSGQANFVEPPDFRKESGWTRREIPPRQWFNWLARKTGLWLRWAEDRIDSLGTASLADTGTEDNDVPTNGDLGTASLADTGTGADEVPTNEDIASGEIAEVDAQEVREGGERLATRDFAVPIGSYVTVQTDLTGAEEPDPKTHIKLEAGLTGESDYNEGKLDNESVSGSAPLVEATAEIVDSESPLNGQTVHLLETERRFLRAGEAGTVENDQMQRIAGTIDARGLRTGSTASFTSSGALDLQQGEFSGLGSGTTESSGLLTLNSANSQDARASDTTDGETRAKNIGVSVYMRIK